MPKVNKFECHTSGAFRPGRGSRRRARRWAMRNTGHWSAVIDRHGYTEYSAISRSFVKIPSFWVHGPAAGGYDLRRDYNWGQR